MPSNKLKGSFTNRNSRITKPPFNGRLDTFVTQDLRVSFNYTADLQRKVLDTDEWCPNESDAEHIV
jgi:hypothetical protein